MTSNHSISTLKYGKAVPLSIPSNSPSFKVLKSLRAHYAHLQARSESLEQLQQRLDELSDEPRWDAHIPVPSTSKLAYAKGQIINTNTVTVNLGGGDGPGDTGYWVEYSAKQAKGVASRKQAVLKTKLAKVKDAILDAESALSAEMGFSGGKVNENNEVLNEEGLPFVDIQEFEEEEETAASTSSAVLETPSQSDLYDILSSGTSQARPPDGRQPQRKSSFATKDASAKPKRVSFAPENEAASAAHDEGTDMDEDLPVISSVEAAATAAQAGSSSSKIIGSSPSSQTPSEIKSAVFERPIKSSIIEREITHPPPVLTAAERSVNRPSAYNEAAAFDGVQSSSHGKKIDLSAYLPKSLRGANIAKQNKGKGREDAMEEDEPEGDEEGQYDEDDMDSDSDGFYNYDDSDDDDDNMHIDDVLAMREAALEYHAKRYNLGAGAGTGPLGGHGRPDEFDEPGLGIAEKAGLPFVESTETSDGQRPPSKFRTGRLSTAQMVIPELQPGLIDINESILPGDSLGPFEDPETQEMATMGPGATNDFKGMSKEEIATFLRYVKALETGEDLEDMKVMPAERPGEAEASTAVSQPAPPVIKETKLPPSVKESVVEKAAVKDTVKDIAPKVSSNGPQTEEAKEETRAPPKRVSRFRAAREGQQ